MISHVNVGLYWMNTFFYIISHIVIDLGTFQPLLPRLIYLNKQNFLIIKTYTSPHACPYNAKNHYYSLQRG